MRNNKMLAAIVMSVILIPSAAALYLANMSFTGNVAVAGGSQPDSQSFVWNVNMAAGAVDTQDFIYDNLNGDQLFDFTIDTTGISSTTGNCVFKDGQDMNISISINGNSVVLLNGVPESLEVSSGCLLYTSPGPRDRS